MSRKVPVLSDFVVTLDYNNHEQLQRDVKFKAWDGNLVMEIWKNEDCGSVREFVQYMDLEEALAVQEALNQAIEFYKAEKLRLEE